MVVNLDLLTYAGNLRNLADLEERQHYCFVCGDIADANFVPKVMAEAQIDTVVHFAPESHGDRSISDPQSLVGTNVLGTQVLLEAARRYAIDSGKIRSRLGWNLPYRFEHGIVQTVQWYMSHAAWWQSILDGTHLQTGQAGEGHFG
ncbi:GDP-mannose 4,6-dehydratase [Paenibacillus elgii]|uniref:GDP-mannose 4,6-dehydratase n=1 Tax=Paenibacillus elgii TaxID=189691 RepID=UPI0022B24A4C|nr:GDP-mannose 4,6-dehydratase [Paenibacillus elgii]